MEEEQIRQYIAELKASDASKNVPIYEYKLERVGTQTASRVRIGYPGGQPQNGTVFHSPGGFYWTDGGNNVDVSVSVGYGLFSVSVARGNAGRTGMFVSAPTNTPCKLVVHKDIDVTRYRVYRRTVSGGANPGSWIYQHNQHVQTPVRNYLSVERV